jgi:hypothetical protein
MRAVKLALAAAAAASSSAAAATPSSIRAAVYVGAGANAGSADNYTLALQQLVASGALASVTPLNGSDVGAQLTNAAFDVVVFPGGSGSQEFVGIDAAGQAAVKAFVRAGGGYLGTCAGAYLALTGTCCDTPIPGYCGGATGCSKSATMLGLVDGYATGACRARVCAEGRVPGYLVLRPLC